MAHTQWMENGAPAVRVRISSAEKEKKTQSNPCLNQQYTEILHNDDKTISPIHPARTCA